MVAQIDKAVLDAVITNHLIEAVIIDAVIIEAVKINHIAFDPMNNKAGKNDKVLKNLDY